MQSLLGDTYKHSTAVGYFSITLLYVGLGLLLALLINTVSNNLEKRFNWGPWTSIASQLSLNVLVLYIIQTFISPQLVDDLQNTTPGLLFEATFFGVQLVLATNLQQIAHSLEK